MITNWVYQIQSWIIKFLRFCIVISFLQKNFDFNFNWSFSDTKNKSQISDIDLYNGSNMLNDDDTFNLDHFFHVQ